MEALSGVYTNATEVCVETVLTVSPPHTDLFARAVVPKTNITVIKLSDNSQHTVYITSIRDNCKYVLSDLAR